MEFSRWRCGKSARENRKIIYRVISNMESSMVMCACFELIFTLCIRDEYVLGL